MRSYSDRRHGRSTTRASSTPRPLHRLMLLLVLPVLLLGTLPANRATSQDGAVWRSGGPDGGYVTSIAIAPSDPDVVYAGTVSGMYVSRDDGTSWSAAGLREFAIPTVRVDPADPDVVYAVAEEATASGLYRSTDGGADWIRSGPAGAQALDIDPSNPQVLWLGTDTGHLHRSTDHGESWTLLLHKQYSSWSMGQTVWNDHPITSVLVDPEDPGRVYLALGRGDDDAFGWTEDGGSTWQFSRVGRLTPGQARDLAVTPAGYAPQALFIVSSGDSSVSYSDAVYRSLDQGGTWEMIAGQVGSTVVVDPTAPRRLLLGTTSTEQPLVVFDHTDGSWSDASAGLPTPPFTTWASPDAVAVSPDGSGVAYLGFQRGHLHRSQDGGRTWELPPGGIHNADVLDLAISPTNPMAVLVSGGGLFGMHRTQNAGQSWSVVEGSPDHAGMIAIDPTNEARMLVGAGLGSALHRTEDGGNTWTGVDEQSLSGPFRDMWIHPERPEIILTLKDERTSGSMIYYGGVRRSTDGGASWTQVRNWWRPTVLAHDPSTPDVVYLGLADLGYVERSTDAGLTWSNISPQEQWAGRVNDLVVGSDASVYAATTDHEGNQQGGIWRWDGAKWTRIARFAPTVVTSLAIDRNTDPDTAYAGTNDQGVLVSRDGGASWEAFDDGLEGTRVTRLELSPTRPSMLYATLHHGGVWSIGVDQPPSEVPPVNGPPAEEPPSEDPPSEEPPEDGPPQDGQPGDQSPVVFDDVAPDSVHAASIGRLVAAGITQGCAADRFCPTDPVTRQQMAAFLTRALDLSVPAEPVAFADVAADSTHHDAIQALAAAEITLGCGPDRFCPTDPVRRDQMASFLTRALDLPVPDEPVAFADVAADSTHHDAIQALAAAEITRGCGPGRFCPTDPVRRDQMASFLIRALDP